MIAKRPGVPSEAGMTKELSKGAILKSKVGFAEVRTQRAAPVRTLHGMTIDAGRGAVFERHLASKQSSTIFNFSGVGQLRVAFISRFNVRTVDCKIIQN